MPRSSADPFKLSHYSTAGLELVATLKAKSTALTTAAEALSQSTSYYVPSMEAIPANFADLVGDRFHLDEFAGDVANGFFQANERLDRRTGPIVVSLDDATLIRAGNIGYADRDVAIAEANAMADELDRLRRDGASAEEMRALLAQANRGQYDPAFAVTFSERVGVEGYVAAMGLIRDAWPGRVPFEGIEVATMFGTMLTTALDTRPGIAPEDHRYPENALLADDQRLSQAFVDDLISGYDPESTGDPDARWDLSVLIRFTDPPTDVAVAIANSRMTPRLLGLDRNMVHNEADEPWGDYAGLVTNYATMLGRNDDAASLWLSDSHNADLLLRRPWSHDLDRGITMGHLVEVAVTNVDPTMREPAMRNVITTWGAQGGDAAIVNPHLYGALSDGVAQNMPLVDHMINEGFDEVNGSANFSNTRSLLTALAADPAATERIHAAAALYVDQQLDELPGGRDFGPNDRNTPLGLERLDRLEELGRLLGTEAQAESRAAAEVIVREATDADKRAAVVNYLVARVPYLEEANLAAKLILENDVGDVLAGNPSPEELERRLTSKGIEIQLRAKEEIDGMVIDPWDRAAMLSACDCNPLPR